MKLSSAECAVGLFDHHDVICAIGETLGLLGFGRRGHVKVKCSVGCGPKLVLLLP